MTEKTTTIEKNYDLPDDIVGIKDDKIYKRLAKEVLDSDLPGPDYLEFRQQLMSMQDLDVDIDPDKLEEFIFKAAYKIVKGGDNSLTKQILMNSLTHYIKIVKDQEKSFNKEFNEQVKVKIGAKFEKIDNLDEETEKILTQIEELKDRLESIKEDKKITIADVDIEKKKLSKVKSNFKATASELVGKLEEDKLKIDKYIKD